MSGPRLWLDQIGVGLAGLEGGGGYRAITGLLVLSCALRDFVVGVEEKSFGAGEVVGPFSEPPPPLQGSGEADCTDHPKGPRAAGLA